MSRERSKGAAGQDGVEMGERSSLGQQPGYNGICSYTQKITSCFGLDGKARVGRTEGGVVQGAGITWWNVWRVFGVFSFYCGEGREVVFCCACLCCFCQCVRRVDDSFGGQCCAAAEQRILSYSRARASACVGGRRS